MTAKALERLRARFKSRDPERLIVKDTAGALVGSPSDDRNVRVTATTSRLDMDSEVIVSSGWVPGSYFVENRAVFFDHLYDDPNFVGQVRRGYPTRAPDRSEILFRVRRNARGDQLLKDVEDFGVSVSIGLEALDAGPPTDEEIEKYGGGVPFPLIVRRWDWLETSVVWNPANASARLPGPEHGEELTAEKSAPAPRRRPILTPHGLIIPRGVVSSPAAR